MREVNHIVVVDRLPSQVDEEEGRLIVDVRDYIAGQFETKHFGRRAIKVINLCHDYGYLKSGYYCSLLGDARGHRCIPDVSDIVHANWKRIYRHTFSELKEELDEKKLELDSIEGNFLETCIFFGRTNVPVFERLARKIFDAFRLPTLKLGIKRRRGGWELDSVDSIPLEGLGEHVEFFNRCLSEFVGSYWSKTHRHSSEKYWLAILHDPEESEPPSNVRALKRMVSVGKKVGFYVELITKRDLHSLLEFDALFIRETTAVNHHTYRFAQKAEIEGIPCIDDTQSILRCCNKVYLQELLQNKRIKIPYGRFFYKHRKSCIDTKGQKYPLVLKIPDGSFSRDVYKVEDEASFKECLSGLFKKSELVLCQEFIQSEFDWRIILLGGRPLVACKYYMVSGYWKIYSYEKKKKRSGDAECVALDRVPTNVMQTAIKAARLIGDGFYGVDLKEVGKEVYVIEINDNPNIDAGLEDKILGDGLYFDIFNHFRNLIDA